MDQNKYLDMSGLQYLWGKIKQIFVNKTDAGAIVKVSETQPVETLNRVWIDPTLTEEISIATSADLAAVASTNASSIQALNDDVSDLSSAITAITTINESITYSETGCIICNQQEGANVPLTPDSDTNWRCTVLSCQPGDKFHIHAQGANSGRAWAFITSDNKMIRYSSSGVVDETITADPTAGKIILNDKSGSGEAYKIVGEDVVGELQEAVETLYDTVDSNAVSRMDFLAIEQGLLNIGSGNPDVSQYYVRTITKITTPMHIDTLSDDFRIANAFIYNVSDDSFDSYTAIGARSADITPAEGKYIRLTFRRKNEAAITPEDIQPGLFATTTVRKANDTDSNTQALTVRENVKNQFVTGAYISNSGSVGSTIDTSPVSNSSYAYIICPCRVGDVFTLTGTGGSSQRLYSFTDENYKKVLGVAQNTTLTNANLTAEVNGYFIANVQIASAYDLTVVHRVNVGNIIETIKDIVTDYSSLFVQRYIIATSGSVGDAISLTPQQQDAYAYAIAPCVTGDKFVLTAKGGTTGLVWCFVDKDLKKVKGASVTTVNNLSLKAEKDGYLIVNAQRSYGYSLVKIGTFDPSIVQSLFNSLNVGFILPKNFYGITGNELYWYTPEMFSNWRHLGNYEVVTTNVTGVQSIEDSVAPRMIVPLQTKRLNIRLHDFTNNEDEEKYIELKTTTPIAESSASVLVIGDSFIKYTWGEGVLKYVDDFAEDDGVTLNFIGTVTTGYGYHAEARGGWSAVDYLTHYVPVAQRDPSATDEQKKMPSPFVFSDNDTVEDAYFDFAKYLTTNSLSAPDIIMISLGMNGGDTSAAAIDEMITKIHTDYPNIKIIVSMIPTVPRRIDTGDFYTRKTSRENQNLSYLSHFDDRDSEKVYISSEHFAIDGILGLTGSEQNVNPVSFEDSDKVMEIVNTGIHPTAIGAWNLAKFKYNVLVYVMNLA